MPLISLVRDTDAKIKAAPFSDGQVAVAYNSGNIYFDIQHLEDETNVQERVVVTNNKIFTGTSAEWLALSAADKAKYEIVNITDDDEEDGEIKLYNTTGQNADGAMTQKAVTDALGFVGTTAQWEALSASDKAKYRLINITDDSDDSIALYNTTGQNTDGAMTQKAVTDALAAIQAQIDYIMENYTGG